MAKGNLSAFQRVRPIQTDLGDVAREQEQVDFQRKREDRVDSELARRHSKELSNDKERALSNIKNVYTGVGSIDEGLAYGVNKATEEMINVVEALERETDTNKKTKLQLKKANLLKYSDNLSQMVKMYKDYAVDVTTGLQNGKYNKELNGGLLNELSGVFKDFNFVTDFDENGNPTLFKDVNGQPTETKFADFFNGEGLKKPVANYSKDVFLKELKGRYETHKQKDDNNDFTSKTTVGLTQDDITSIKSDVVNLIGEEGAPTDQAKAMWVNSGKDIKDFNYQELKTELESDGIRQFKTEEINEIDHNAKTSRVRANKYGTPRTTKPKNALRTSVEGILAGDSQYLNSLIDQKLQEQGSNGLDVYIEDIDYSDGTIRIKKSNGEYTKIDTSNRKQAIAEILELVRPDDDPDLRNEEFEKGESEKEFSQNKASGNSKIRVDGIVSNMPKLERDAVRYLKKEGYEGFTRKTNGGHDEIIAPNGTTFDLTKKSELSALKEYLLENKSNSRLDQLPN